MATVNKSAADQSQSFVERYREQLFGLGFLAPVILLLTIVIFIPIVMAVYNSLFSISTLSPQQEWVGLANYVGLLQDSMFWQSMGHSVYFAVGSTLLQLALALPTALLLNKELKGVAVARAIALLPYLIPTIVVGMTFTWMLHPQLGVVSILAQQLGISDSPVYFFGSTQFAMPSLIVANSWKFTAFMVMMFLARLQSIPDSFYESAKMCGANSWEQFRDITLPNLRSVILLVLLLRGIWMFNKFDIIWILTQGGPQNATTTLPVYIYEIAFVNFNLGRALAASTFLFVVLIVVGIIYLSVFNPADEVDSQ